MPNKSRIYRVICTIDVEALSAAEAAHNAMMILHGPKPPMKFQVAEKRRVDGEFVEIDLSKEN